MIIDWKNPCDQLPDDGVYVAALRYHWKECWPLSAEIMFGEVESYVDSGGIRVARVNTCDFTGAGSSYWMFPYNGMGDSDCIVAWEYSIAFKRPDFLNHNKHWGNEK